MAGSQYKLVIFVYRFIVLESRLILAKPESLLKHLFELVIGMWILFTGRLVRLSVKQFVRVAGNLITFGALSEIFNRFRFILSVISHIIELKFSAEKLSLPISLFKTLMSILAVTLSYCTI